MSSTPIIPLCLFHGTSLYELGCALPSNGRFMTKTPMGDVLHSPMLFLHGEAAILWDALLYMNGGEVPVLPVRFTLLAGTNLSLWIRKFEVGSLSYSSPGATILHGYRIASVLYLLDQHGLLPTYPTGEYSW